MKSLFVKDLLTIINGKLIYGDEETVISDATPYIDNIKQNNTLLFLLRKWRVKWDLLKMYRDIIIVTDKVIDQLENKPNIILIKVENDELAYNAFIDFYRSQFKIPVIAVTGTSGKSTTVGMIEHVLKGDRKVIATVNSANGRTSHFKYLMKIDDSTEVGVFETAVGRPLDITHAFRYFKPQIGIITNVGIHHLDECRSIEGYIAAKSEMITNLPVDGMLIINNDDKNTKLLPLIEFKGQLKTVGIYNEADYKASNISYGNNGMNFDLSYQGRIYPLFVPGFGYHEIYNALQALAAVNTLGVGITIFKDRIQSYKKLACRLALRKGINGSDVIDDTWNITTTSLVSALQTFNEIAGSKKKVVLLGDIHRTGDKTKEVILEYADIFSTYGKDINTLICLGDTGILLINELLNKGFSNELIQYKDMSKVLDYLQNILDADTCLLLKVTIEDAPEVIRKIFV